MIAEKELNKGQMQFYCLTAPVWYSTRPHDKEAVSAFFRVSFWCFIIFVTNHVAIVMKRFNQEIIIKFLWTFLSKFIKDSTVVSKSNKIYKQNKSNTEKIKFISHYFYNEFTACVYLNATNADNLRPARIVAAKTRVAPLTTKVFLGLRFWKHSSLMKAVDTAPQHFRTINLKVYLTDS